MFGGVCGTERDDREEDRVDGADKDVGVDARDMAKISGG